MPSIAVWEAMDANNTVLEPNSNFNRWVGIVFVPILSVIQQVFKVGWNLPFVNADVLVGFPKLTSPCPYIGIHSFMHRADKVFSKNQLRLKVTT